MNTQLKHLYGRRFTPAAKILILVAIIILGISLAYKDNPSGRAMKEFAPKEYFQKQLPPSLSQIKLLSFPI